MKKKEKLPEFMTVREIAKLIKVSESHIYARVSQKKIPYTKLGGKVLFDKAKILEWISKNSVDPSKPRKTRKKKGETPERTSVSISAPLTEIPANQSNFDGFVPEPFATPEEVQSLENAGIDVDKIVVTQTPTDVVE